MQWIFTRKYLIFIYIILYQLFSFWLMFNILPNNSLDFLNSLSLRINVFANCDISFQNEIGKHATNIHWKILNFFHSIIFNVFCDLPSTFSQTIRLLKKVQRPRDLDRLTQCFSTFLDQRRTLALLRPVWDTTFFIFLLPEYMSVIVSFFFYYYYRRFIIKIAQWLIDRIICSLFCQLCVYRE